MITASNHAAHTTRALLLSADAGPPPTDDEAQDAAAGPQAPEHRADAQAVTQDAPVYPPLPLHALALLARTAAAPRTAAADTARGTAASGPPFAAARAGGAAHHGGRRMVEVNLPGLGKTFLDAEMAIKVKAWIQAAQAKGVDLHFNSAYRDQARQSSLRHDPRAITPAERSLHSAGLAVDVQYSSLRHRRGGMTADQQRTVIRETAAQAGLKWGGDFKKKDPPHFYLEPAGDRQALIDRAARQVEALRRSHA